jgi:hypothetical protein
MECRRLRFWRRSRWRKRKRANGRAEAHPAPSIQWADAAASPGSLLKASAAAREARLRTRSMARVAAPASIKEGRPKRAIIQDSKTDKPTLQPSTSKGARRRGGRRSSAAKAAPVASSRLSINHRYHRADVDFPVQVGTRIPTTIEFYDPPAQVVQIDPVFQGYKIVVLDDVILVIDPATREIIDVIRA